MFADYAESRRHKTTGQLQKSGGMGMCRFCLRIARKGRGGIIAHPRGERPREGLKRAKNGVSGDEVRTSSSNLGFRGQGSRGESQEARVKRRES